MKRPNRYKRIITGVTGSATGFGVSSTILPSEADHCQKLVALIDNKDVFTADIGREVPDAVIKAVQEVRSMAVSTEGLIDGEETYGEVNNIARACRQFMRDYDTSMDPEVLEAALMALRASVGESVAFLVHVLELRPPKDFDVSPYQERGLDILSEWLNRQ